jgi:hypothetical protein
MPHLWKTVTLTDRKQVFERLMELKGKFWQRYAWLKKPQRAIFSFDQVSGVLAVGVGLIWGVLRRYDR